jgi:hypothetical protein
LFAVKALGYVLKMFPELLHVRKLREEILLGVNNYGIWKDAQNNKHYCYEVDGLGGCNKMDDANVPSLLSIPYIDPEGYDRVIWQNTYKWIWSSNNPYFYKGSFAEGIGSPHTPKGYIWPMSLVIRAIVDPSVSKEMRAKIEESKVRGKLHESFYKDDPRRLTREDFNWPNELYKELVVREPVKPAPPITISIDQILWSRNWHHLVTCQTVDPSYYKVGGEARQSVETLKKYFLGCSGIIWIRMGSHKSTGDVTKFALDVAPLMTSPFSLITTDGDAAMPSFVPAAKQLLENPFLVNWYTQNYDGSIEHPKLKAIPIGFDLHTHVRGLWSEDPGENLKKMLELRSSNHARSMVPLKPPWSWDHPDRRKAAKAIKCVKHDHPSKMPINDLWHSYKEHYFVLSPFGNGLDCHRTWELLFFGAIPIVKTSSLDRLYVNLPVIIVKDWSDICSEGFFEDQLTKLKGIWPASLEVFHMNHWLSTVPNKY